MVRLLLALLTLAACVEDPAPRPSPAEAPPRAEAPSRIEAPLRTEMPRREEFRPGVGLDRLLAASNDADSVLSTLRAPRRREVEAVANRHVAGQIDTAAVWVYDGLSIGTYVITDGRTVIDRLAVTEGSYGTSDGLSVGETRASLEAVLGLPVRQTAADVTYSVGDGMATGVEVRYAPDDDGVERALRIIWCPPFD